MNKRPIVFFRRSRALFVKKELPNRLKSAILLEQSGRLARLSMCASVGFNKRCWEINS